MRQFIAECWDGVMSHDFNPLKHIPDLQVRHMMMQVLAFMWSSIFAILIVDSVWAFGISAIAHIMFIGGVVITVATFKVAESNPNAFNFVKGYHSYGRGRGHVIMRDKKHLIKHSEGLEKKAKEKVLFRTQRQPVEAGAHGTLDYTIKKGVNKDKIANDKIIKSK